MTLKKPTNKSDALLHVPFRSFESGSYGSISLKVVLILSKNFPLRDFKGFFPSRFLKCSFYF